MPEAHAHDLHSKQRHGRRGRRGLSNDAANGGNFGNDGGGGIYNNDGTITLTNCTVANSFANWGGGIRNNTGSTATLTGCTLNNNSGGDGGGMFDVGNSTLTNCTIANNSVYNAGGGFYKFSGTATLTNCTVSGNSALVSANGSGTGGGIVNDSGATLLNLINTIVAGNTATVPGPDVYNLSTIMADHDLIGDGTHSGIANGGGNQVGTSSNPINAQLGPLQNNGGPTQTMALQASSPAIGAADNHKAPRTDQRGVIRLDEFGETTDIGAYET